MSPIHSHNLTEKSIFTENRANYEENQVTCEKLDKKIQEEAMMMLQKVKVQRSPSRKSRYNSAQNSQNNRSIIYRSDLKTDLPFTPQNLLRRY